MFELNTPIAALRMSGDVNIIFIALPAHGEREAIEPDKNKFHACP